jgi:hypothetical protein
MRLLELFCGTKSVGKVFEQNGWEVVSVDILQQFDPTHCGDILQMEFSDHFDVVWASPPCTAFSVASIGKHWKLGLPSKEAVLGNKLLSKTLGIINITRPKYWFIENPRGMMRTLPIMANLPKKTVTYCKYGDTRMKPTDIWTNCDRWIPKEACKNGDSCHVSAPRGSRTGTQGLNGDIERSVIPEALVKEIFSVITMYGEWK